MPQYELVVVAGTNAGNRQTLTRKRTVIGRKPGQMCPDYEYMQFVECRRRYQFELKWDKSLEQHLLVPNQVLIRVNGDRVILPSEPAGPKTEVVVAGWLHDKDVITTDSLVLRYQLMQE